MVLKDFYHYTGEDAIDAILDSGYIRESEDGGPDAHFGKERNLKEFKGSGRQVYLHRGPIRLDEYDWDVLQV
nr:hypothetical protein BaRGS_023180 [Batillaria attramentaria]